MNWPEHPDDEWVEVTGYSATGEPEFMRAVGGAERAISLARAAYLAGAIPVEVFEARFDEAVGL